MSGHDRSAYQKEYYEANKEKILARQKERRKANRKKRLAPTKEYQEASRKKRLAQKKEWRKANKEKISAWQKKWRKANKEKMRAWQTEYRLQKQYGMSLADYNKILSEQGGGCGVCKKEQRGRRLAVDHCHATGRVRGLLCNACNLGIGKLGDTVSDLERAVGYLRRSEAQV